MNFLADEGVDRQIVERLRQMGYQVLYIVFTSDVSGYGNVYKVVVPAFE